MKNWKTPAAAIAATFLLGACATRPTNTEIGVATGAVAGGVVGAVLTGGSTFGTVAGAGAGAVVGHEIAKRTSR